MLAESQLDDRLLKGVDAHVEHEADDDGEDGGPHLAIDVSTIRESGKNDDWQERDDATHRHLGTRGASHIEDGLLVEEIIIEFHTGDAVVFHLREVLTVGILLHLIRHLMLEIIEKFLFWVFEIHIVLFFSYFLMASHS